MSYLLVVFDTFFILANSIKIPIPLTTTNVVYVSLFSVFIVFLVFSILFWFLKEFFGFGEYVAKGVDSREINTEIHNSINSKNKDK